MYSTLNLYSRKNKQKYVFVLFAKQELDMPIGCDANIKKLLRTIVYKAILFSSVLKIELITLK